MSNADIEQWFKPPFPTVGYERVTRKSSTSVTYLNIDEQMRLLEDNVHKSARGDHGHDTLIETEEQMVPALGENHPWAHLAGKYDDDPVWDEFIEAIEDYRRSIDEQEDTTE